MNNIAVLMTCHNRRPITIACLSRLFECRSDVDVFCVDDDSSDGTYSAIHDSFPQVHLIRGNGNLYWCRGMRRAWEVARESRDYDYYVWLNDDLMLYSCAFNEIIECSNHYENKAIISGLVQDELSGGPIYGGYDEKQNLIIANGSNNKIHRLNGNFVIVPRYVFEKIGYFDRAFHHDIGDVDYGYTAQELGIPVLSTRCYIGSSKASLKQKNLRIRKNGVGVLDRFRALYSPLGAPPSIHFYFIKKHFGIVKACFYYVYLHVINIIPDFCRRLFFKENKENTL